MGDLVCSGFNNWKYNHSYNADYPRTGIPEKFIVEEYEVFQVIGK